MPDQPGQPVSPEESPEATYVDTTGALITSDVIEKVNAGAALVHGLYHLPGASVAALLDNASPQFRAVYEHAQAAYGFEGHE